MKKLSILFLITIFIPGLIYSGTINVNSPNGGEILKQGSVFNISWNGSGLTNQVKITLWQNNSLVGLIVKDQPASGTYRWTSGNYMGGAACGSGYKIKIREQGGASYTTEGSSSSFTIAQLTLTSPNGGENWTDGSIHNITWTACGVSGNVTIELIKVILKRPSYSTAKALHTGSVNSGSFSWTINENLRSSLQAGSKIKVESTYIIRITSVNNSSIKDMSNRNFKITPKTIVLRPLKPDFEVKDIYKESGSNKFFARIINNGYKYNGHLMLKYMQNRERGASSQIVNMGRGAIKNILIITKRLEVCDKLSLSVEVDSNRSIAESNENNNIKQKDFFAISEPDGKLESVKVFSDDGRWVEVRDGGSIRKRAKNIKMQVTVRNCGGTRIAGAKVGAMWNFISQHSGTTYKKRKYFPNSSLFYKQVKKWLPCQDFLKNIQELINKTIRPGMAKTYIITGNLNYSACTGILKIVKNEITVYLNNGESGSRNRNNTLKFRITH